MCRKIIAVILSILFVPIFLIFLSSVNIKMVILNPQTYIKELNKANLYQKLADEMVNYAENYFKNNQDMSNFSGADITKFFKEVIDIQWLKSNSEMIITNYLEYSSGKSKSMIGEIDFTKLKKQINNSLIDVITNKIDNLPKCTQEQLKNTQTEKLENLQCRPPGLDENKIKDELSKSINENPLIKLPDKYQLANSLDYLKSNFGSNLVSLLPKISNLILLFSLIASVILLLIVGFLVYKPFYEILRWYGILLLVSGILYLSSGLMPFILSYTIKNLLQSGKINSIELNQFIEAILLKNIVSNIALISIILIVFSIALFLIAKAMKKNALDK